jgi:hypothetical protein
MICTSLAIVSAIACAQQTGLTHGGAYAAKLVNLTGSWNYELIKITAPPRAAAHVDWQLLE